MRSACLSILFLLLISCADHYPLNANLNLQIISQSGGKYPPGTTATFDGRDIRDNSEVLLYNLKNTAPVRITNLSPPHILVTERLAGGFRQQGLLNESGSSLHIMVEIQELLAQVTRPRLLYTTRAQSTLSLTFEHQGRTLTKNYALTSSRESVSKPKVAELEELLDTQLSEIVEQILDDEAVKNFITTR